MKSSRRSFLIAAAGVAALHALPRAARAETFPARSVRVIVPFAPGGPVDTFGRLLAEKFSDHFGQQFFIENIGGAGGNIGTEKAAKSPADGYTLLLTANNHVINPLLYGPCPTIRSRILRR